MKLPPNPTDDQLEEFNKKQLFTRDALPSEWLSYAEDLGQAAETLWADSDNRLELQAETQLDKSLEIIKSIAHSRSYILLASLALENVLKGLLVAGDSKLVSGGYLDKTLKSHKLVELARRINELVLSNDEESILEVCQDAIPYWGRYPIPLEYKGLKPKEAASSEFRDTFRTLHFRLCKRLYDLLKDGRDSGVGPKTLKMRSVRYGDSIDMKEKLPWVDTDDK